MLGLVDRCDTLGAENERLLALNERLRQSGFAEAEKSERLRAALQVYADEYEGGDLAREVLGQR